MEVTTNQKTMFVRLKSKDLLIYNLTAGQNLKKYTEWKSTKCSFLSEIYPAKCYCCMQ